jgi:hypothetical protein
VRILWVFCVVATACLGQATEDDFHVYRDPPRLLLTAQRQRLLERERDRDSVRWQFFDAAGAGEASDIPEPGFSWALHFRVTKQNPVGRKAIAWALSEAGSDLRQLALVYDWCSPLLTAAEADRLEAKLRVGLAQRSSTMVGQSARALAAIALADKLPDAGHGVLREVAHWWRGQTALPREDLYAAFELLHAIRDNTKFDLRESNAAYFASLPLDYIGGVYPAAFPGPTNDLRIPIFQASEQAAEPNPTVAIRDRAAGLAMVALDTNAVNYQFLQGLLMTDRFVLRDALGAPYEFLWANPYQPGLAYQTLPMLYHDPATGHLFARTSWEEDATWLGYFDGSLQLFRNGGVQTVRKGTPVAPLRIGDAVVTVPRDPAKIQVKLEGQTLFVIGVRPHTSFAVEIDDQELDFVESDSAGTLVIASYPNTDAEVRIQQR